MSPSGAEIVGYEVSTAYCAVCCREADRQLKRLGEAFCSDAHTEEFEEEVQRMSGTGANPGMGKRRG